MHQHLLTVTKILKTSIPPLQGKVDAVPKHDILMIIGDWNAKVGKDYTSWSPTIGKHGFGDANDRGERLLFFCI